LAHRSCLAAKWAVQEQEQQQEQGQEQCDRRYSGAGDEGRR